MLTLVELPQDRAARRYVGPPVTVAGQPANPAWGVELAFITGADRPDDGDWLPATWQDGRACVLVGPGGDVELPVGIHTVWIRITAVPELVVDRAGLLKIT